MGATHHALLTLPDVILIVIFFAHAEMSDSVVSGH